jgi:metal-responsive CopG/Arc/MetJ family transcriptional regulator
MIGLRVISAKIPEELFSELEELRRSLRIGTRQELIERSLILYLRSAKASEQLFTIIGRPERNGSLPLTMRRTEPPEGQTSTLERQESSFSVSEGRHEGS